MAKAAESGEWRHDVPGSSMEASSLPPSESTGEPRQPLVAFRTSPRPLAPIEPAPRWREWMNETDQRFANLCLPMLMANQSGWMILAGHGFTAEWDGGRTKDALVVTYDAPSPHAPLPAVSYFGYGILTWHIPYLFRTPPGCNLLARGPANMPKDGIGPLEGLVESDWWVATFTMNWKMTRPGASVRFEKGEPFCMIVPQARGELESFQGEVRAITTDPATREDVRAFTKIRNDAQVRQFIKEHYPEAAGPQHDLKYFRGQHLDGSAVPSHQTKRDLLPFERRD